MLHLKMFFGKKINTSEELMDRTLLIKVLVLEADVNCHLTSNILESYFSKHHFPLLSYPYV